MGDGGAQTKHTHNALHTRNPRFTPLNYTPSPVFPAVTGSNKHAAPSPPLTTTSLIVHAYGHGTTRRPSRRSPTRLRHQQPANLCVSAHGRCWPAALRSSPQSISGPPSVQSPAAKWRRNPPPGADRDHRPSTCTTATQSKYVKLERVAVVDCTTNDLPSCLRVQGSAQPTSRVRHRQLACSSCRQQRSPRATGTDVERTYVFADQGGGA